jgi:hypothetical protein
VSVSWRLCPFLTGYLDDSPQVTTFQGFVQFEHNIEVAAIDGLANEGVNAAVASFRFASPVTSGSVD